MICVYCADGQHNDCDLCDCQHRDATVDWIDWAKVRSEKASSDS